MNIQTMSNTYNNDELPTSNIYPNKQEWQNLGDTLHYTPSVSIDLKKTEVLNNGTNKTEGYTFQPPLQKYNSKNKSTLENSPRTLSIHSEQVKNLPIKPIDPQIRKENEHPNNPIYPKGTTIPNHENTTSVKLDFSNLIDHQGNTHVSPSPVLGYINGGGNGQMGNNHQFVSNTTPINIEPNKVINMGGNNNSTFNNNPNVTVSSSPINSLIGTNGQNLFTSPEILINSHLDKAKSPPLQRMNSGTTLTLNKNNQTPVMGMNSTNTPILGVNNNNNTPILGLNNNNNTPILGINNSTNTPILGVNNNNNTPILGVNNPNTPILGVNNPLPNLNQNPPQNPNQSELIPNPLLSNVNTGVNPLEQVNKVVNPLGNTTNNLISNPLVPLSQSTHVNLVNNPLQNTNTQNNNNNGINITNNNNITNPLQSNTGVVNPLVSQHNLINQNPPQENNQNSVVNPLRNSLVNNPINIQNTGNNVVTNPLLPSPRNGNGTTSPVNVNGNTSPINVPLNQQQNQNNNSLINFTENQPQNPSIQNFNALINPLNTQVNVNPHVNTNNLNNNQLNTSPQQNIQLNNQIGQSNTLNPQVNHQINNQQNPLVTPLNPQVNLSPQITHLNPQINQLGQVNTQINQPVNHQVNQTVNTQHVNNQINQPVNPLINQQHQVNQIVNPISNQINQNNQILNNSLPQVNQNNQQTNQNNQLSQQVNSSVENEPDDDLIPSGELQYEFEIARGTFGVVYKGTWHKTDVAIKRLIGSKLTPKQVKEFKQEISVLKKLRHPNVVLFMGYSDDEEDLCIVTEYLSEGSVWNILHDPKRVLPWQKRLKIALDTAIGMNYLHHQGIIHRDLKSPNLLCNEDYAVKICDFGLSKTKVYLQQNALTACIGTFQYMAPEVIDAQPYSQKADVYSYGIVMWELLTREAPYLGKQSTQVAYAVVHKKERPPIPSNLPSYQLKYTLIMQQCWHQSPKNRPDFDGIVDLLKQLKSETPLN